MRARLIERAQGGDRDAFGQLAASEVGRLLAIARLILRDPELAEDAVQETLFRCWRQLPRLRDADRFEGWLYRILVNAARDEAKRYRRFSATVRQITVEPTEADTGELIADREALERGFRRLSVEHRSIVVLHHFAGLPLSEVATAVGVPLGTAKSRYHYALSALRAALDADARTPTANEVLA
jgi:RNA polymerase sigma-70 factor (ECF subfamily)